MDKTTFYDRLIAIVMRLDASKHTKNVPPLDVVAMTTDPGRCVYCTTVNDDAISALPLTAPQYAALLNWYDYYTVYGNLDPYVRLLTSLRAQTQKTLYLHPKTASPRVEF